MTTQQRGRLITALHSAERIAVTNDSGIENDPTDWSEDRRSIVGQSKRVVRVRIGIVRLIKRLPCQRRGFNDGARADLVGGQGLEPWTWRLRVACSTN